MLKLSIIILNYNTLDLTTKCIKTIEKNYKIELTENEFEIIVVDNASSDQSAEQIKNQKSEIKNLDVIESKTNLGFGNGCNLAATKAKGEYLLFLNSDTEVQDNGFTSMIEFLSKNPKVGILGGGLKNVDGTKQASVGSSYNLWNVIFLILGFERLGFLRKSPKKTEEVAWVSGACMMISKKVFDRIGGFEKELFMYMEDVDICFRAKKKGFDTYYFPDVNIAHRERGSSNKTFAILNIYKGLLFFFNKHKPKLEYVIVKYLLFLKALILLLIGKIFGKEYLIKTYGQALELF